MDQIMHGRRTKGYEIERNIFHQDNKSAILLEENSKKSSGERTWVLNIPYFFLTDQVEKGSAIIIHCLTDDIIEDFHTKPLLFNTKGEKFRKFGNAILGCWVTGEQNGFKWESREPWEHKWKIWLSRNAYTLRTQQQQQQQQQQHHHHHDLYNKSSLDLSNCQMLYTWTIWSRDLTWRCGTPTQLLLFYQINQQSQVIL